MTHPLVTEHTDSSDFMKQLMGIIQAALVDDDAVCITVSFPEQRADQIRPTVVEASLDGHENIYIEIPQGQETILDLLDWVEDQYGMVASLPVFGKRQLVYLIQNSADTDIEHDAISDQIQRNVWGSAEYNGLMSQLRITMNGIRGMDVTFSMLAAFTADTSEAERALLRAKGLADLHHPVSSPEKVAPILQYTCSTLKKLF